MGTWNNYEIYVTDQELPSLSSAWTRIDVAEKSYRFQRETDKSTTFSISGYIIRNTMEDTENYVTDFNNSLITTPSGTFTDGYGNTYTGIVESWSFKPVPGSPKWTFSMSIRIPNVS